MDRLNTSSSSLPSNPFLTLQSRYLVFGTFFIASPIVGTLYAFWTYWALPPQVSEDPISIPILTISLLTIVGGTILWASRQRGLKISYLVGQRVPQFSVFYGALLVASLLLFSLGISTVVFYVLSLGFPSYVSDLLESNTLLSGAESLYPQLYQWLMLFLLVVYAPLVEEFIFRGFLLQRWAMKWGLRRGVIASSVLFGVLHLSNPVGLTLFGLVMGLLYVRSRSLWVPIACHALNNLAAVGIDWYAPAVQGEQTTTVSDIQALWGTGVILVAVSFPFIAWFVRRSWPKQTDRIPYLLNLQTAQSEPKNL